jgi:hypothetical protein
MTAQTAAETASLKTQLTNAEANGNPAEAARIRKLLGAKADEVPAAPDHAEPFARQDAPAPAPQRVDPPVKPRDDPKRA